MKNKSIETSILAAFFLVFSICINAQQKYYTKSKKAIKKFESAIYQYKLGYFEQSKTELNQALSIDKDFIDAYILLAEIANAENLKPKAIEYYQKAISINADYQPFVYLEKAEILKSNGNYADAMIDYQKFYAFKEFQKDYGNYVSEKMKQCNFAIGLMKNPVEFDPKNLGPEINTSLSEYWPSLTADDSLLVYTVSDRQKRTQEDLFISIRDMGKWNKGLKLGPPVNSQGSEGAQAISADGKTMVFTACLRSDSYGSCDLYISKKKGGNWSTPINMGSIINSSYKESQPSLSANGNSIYFVSNRPGGKGKFDIWKSNLKKEGVWEMPENMGDSINTKEEELAPFIHYDNQTLYFTSQGHLGMGGSDIYISRKDINGIWSKAKNCGYPINTHFDEESLIVSSSGSLGLFSSNMDGGFGQKDIYQFKIPEQLEPKKTIFVKGLVYDSKSLKKLQAQINITNLKDKTNFYTGSDIENGEFLVCVLPGISYAFNVDKPGYMIFSETLFLGDSSRYIDIPLSPIEIGKTAVLKNIFFDFDSYQLKDESTPELKRLIDFIKSNKIVVEIQGHTDNFGTLAHNQKLSENRAKAVSEYLIKFGIGTDSAKFKGYGATKPIANNDTETGRSMNRRTEIVIVGKK